MLNNRRRQIKPDEIVRRYGFWLVDGLTGGKVRKYYTALKKHPGVRPECLPQLQNLLKHSSATTDFYNPFQGCTDIRSYPIVKKNMIRENYDRFISAAFRTRPLHVMKTSGTSGERFAALQNKEKRKRVLAELIYFNERCGFYLGDRYIYSRVWFPANRKSRFVQFAENMLPWDCSSLSDRSLQDLADLLKRDRSIRVIKSYASSLGAIADYFEKMGFAPDLFNLKTVISGAERLDPADKSRLQKILACPVVSRYSNQENGILAQQDKQSDTFLLNTSHYFFEFLQLDSDEPAPAGEPARLILTDLYNRAMPFIRYETGDVVIAGDLSAEGRKQTVLKDVWGRHADIIQDTRGNKLSPHYIALGFRRFDWIREYQLIQEGQTRFRLVAEVARDRSDDRNIHQFLQHLVGPDAQIEIAYMDEIPRETSGKLKKVVSNWKKN